VGALATRAEVAKALREASEVVVCGHVNPDGDAIGSSLGLALSLRCLGINAFATMADDRPPLSTYCFLPGNDLFVRALEREGADVFVAVDTPSLVRLGVAAPLAEASRQVIVIDHHPDNQLFGDLNLVDAEAAAVGEIIFHLLPCLGVQPNLDIVTCLYAALVTDTGRFQYGNTTAETLRDAAMMVECGIDVPSMYTRMYESLSCGALQITGRALSRVVVTNNGHVAYSWITDQDYAETQAAPEETEHLVDAVRMIGGVEAVLFIRVLRGRCRVNLRAKANVDVGSIARLFGGGGHAPAAGLTYDGPMQDLLDKLLPLLPGGEG